jgi:hypothetical protein
VDSGICGAVVNYSAPVGTDNCAGAATVQTAGLPSGSTFPVGVTTNTFEVTDAAGNKASCSFTVTVTDNENPVISCPPNIAVNVGSGICGAVVNYSAPVGTDNCAGAATVQTAGLPSGSTFPVGITTNTFEVTDAAGNKASCSFTITVTDNENPMISCPANIAVNVGTGICGAVVNFIAPVGTDNCAGAATVQTAGLPSGSTFPVGVTTNTFEVTDAAGNKASCSFTVTVTDNENPVISCPSNIAVNVGNGICGAVVNFIAPVGTDNCAGAATVQTAGLASGSTFPVGVTTNTFEVTDAAGNKASCSFTVTVIDNENPAISCPSNIAVNVGTGICGAVVNYSAPVGTDNCAGAATVQTAGLASGSTFPVGVTTNTFEVTDAAGNKASCSFTVTVTDNENPVISCPANIAVNVDAGICGAIVNYSAPVGTDNCAGATTVQTAGLPSGSTFPVGVTTNTFEVTDATGNKASCSFTVTVTDNENPVISCPSNIAVNVGTGICGAVVNYSSPVGTDNCAGAATVQTAGLASGSTFPVGVTTNTFEVTDAAGNKASCSFTVTVTDNENPMISCPANIAVNVGAGICGAIVNYTAPVGTDNCAGATTVQTAGLPSGSTFPVGVTTNTFEVTDAAGNKASCSFTVTVTDNENPVISCPANIAVNVGAGICGAIVNYTAPVGTDNCAGAATVQTAGLPSGSTFPVGVTTNTFEVTDAAGNKASCSFTVTVTDNILPTITCFGNISEFTAAGNCGAVVYYTAPVGTDNCAGANTVRTTGLASGSVFPLGTTTNTFQVTDASGNTASCSFNVTITDNKNPVLTIPSNIAIKCNDSSLPANTGWASATDNCSTPTLTFTDSLGNSSLSCANNYTIFRKWLAQDLYGNKTTGIQRIFVSDVNGPEVVFANQIINVNCPDDIPAYYENLSQFLASNSLNRANDLCWGSVTMELYDEYSFFDSNAGRAGYCPHSVKRTYRFYDQCLNFTEVEQTIFVTNLSNCSCSECTDKVKVYNVDLRANPDSLWSRLNERKDKNAKCCLDDEWWAQGGKDPYRCVSFNVIIDDAALGVQIETSKGQDSKEWRVDCQKVSLEGPDGDIVCLPTGEYHLFTHCKQGADPIDYYIRSVSGIIESNDISTRVNCLNQITTTGDFTGDPIWSALNPLYDKYLDTTDPHNPTFFVPAEDKDKVPPTIQYRVCAHFENFICGQLTNGDFCDTITVNVFDPIETFIELEDVIVCAGTPAYLEPVISPAGSYTIEWFSGSGTIGTPIHTGENYTIYTTGLYSIKVTEYESGLPCNVVTSDFEVKVDLSRPGLNVPPDTLFVSCDDPYANQKIIDWRNSAWGYRVDVHGDTILIDVTDNYTGINLVCDQVVDVVFKAVDNCNKDSIQVSTIVVIDPQPPVMTCPPTATGTVAFNECFSVDVVLGTATATDNCSALNKITISNNAPTQFPLGNTTVIWTATDDCRNSSTCSQLVIVSDNNQAPTITCPVNTLNPAEPDLFVDFVSGDGCTWIPAYVAKPDTADNCKVVAVTYTLSGATVGSSPMTGFNYVNTATLNLGITTVTYTAWDVSGHSSVPCAHRVWIKNIDQPRFDVTCPPIPDITRQADADVCETEITIPAPVIDNFCVEVFSVTYQIDANPPVSVPVLTGNLIDAVTLNFTVGTYNFTWTVTDASGNIHTCIIPINVEDTQKPTINCPVNTLNPAGSDLFVDFVSGNGCTWVPTTVPNPTFADNCGVVAVTYTLSGATVRSSSAIGFNYVSSAILNLGITTVTYTAHDASGNTATCAIRVWIKNIDQPRFDVDCPPIQGITEQTDADVCETEVTIPAPVIDNFCVEGFSVTYQIDANIPVAVPVVVSDLINPVTLTFALGTYTFTWTVTDASGNVHTCIIPITVEDTQNPTVNCPVNTLNPSMPDLFEDFVSGNGCTWVPTNVPKPTFADNCAVVGVTYTLSGATVASSPMTGFNYVNTATLNLGITTVTYAAWDASGNSSVPCTHRVWIRNIDNPRFDVICQEGVSKDIVVPAEAGLCDALVTVPGPEIDNFCVEVYSAIYKINAETPVSVVVPAPVAGISKLDPIVHRFRVGLHTVTWIITDASGNVHSCVQTVNVTDANSILQCPVDIERPVDPGKNYASKIPTGDPLVSGNCDYPALIWKLVPPTDYASEYNPSELSGNGIYPTNDTFFLGVTIITYSLTDPLGNVIIDRNGNPISCSFNVTITVQPIIECRANEVFNADENCEYFFNPGIPTLTQGSHPLNWTWTLSHPGNPPSVPAVNISGGSSTTKANPIPLNLVADAPHEYAFQLGVTTITWTAGDIAGNVSTCFHTITVVDEEPPTYTSAPITNCVDLIQSATYTIGTPQPFNRDNLIIYSNPDGYTFIAGNKTLDLTELEDNCCAPEDMTINWKIDFAQTPDPDGPEGTMMSTSSITGTGQPSEYKDPVTGQPSIIFFPGDGVTFTTVTHTITYEVWDCYGNGPVIKAEDIIVTPRPQIIKMN